MAEKDVDKGHMEPTITDRSWGAPDLLLDRGPWAGSLLNQRVSARPQLKIQLDCNTVEKYQLLPSCFLNAALRLLWFH